MRPGGNMTNNQNALQRLRDHTVVCCLALGAALTMCVAQAGPSGGQVVGGAGSIQYQDQVTNITQSSQRMAIDWQTYEVQRNESVNYSQPNSSAVTLNRIPDRSLSNKIINPWRDNSI